MTGASEVLSLPFEDDIERAEAAAKLSLDELGDVPRITITRYIGVLAVVLIRMSRDLTGSGGDLSVEVEIEIDREMQRIANLMEHLEGSLRERGY